MITKPHTYRIMFSCSKCKAVAPAQAIEVSRRSGGRDTFGNEKVLRGYLFTEESLAKLAAWAPYPATKPSEFTSPTAPAPARGQLHLTKCGACGTARLPSGTPAVSGRDMVVVHKPEHKCDARCRDAKGHKCECSCQGAHHGAGFLSA